MAPASMADKIIILDDDDEEESPQPSCSASTSSSRHRAKKALQPAPTHIIESPFASAKKDTHVLQAENEKLFTEVRKGIKLIVLSKVIFNPQTI